MGYEGLYPPLRRSFYTSTGGSWQMLSPSAFQEGKEINKNGKKIFIGVRPLEKLGRLFSGLDDEIAEHATTTAFVSKEHDQVQAVTSAQAAMSAQATSSNSLDPEAEFIFEKRERYPANKREWYILWGSKTASEV
ncbi:hypothetical protein R6Q57_022838 [Mikania cordata]